MDFTTIHSLESLQRRKRKIKRELKSCENAIAEDFQNITLPFNELLQPDNSIEEDDYITNLEYYSQPKFIYNILKIVKNGKRAYQIINLCKSIFYDYKRK
ncbi:MAG: hypothetical protein LBQ22_07235 [Bacteroidales bacterium]|jgi:uncharacterized protein YeeX (DUF496 family)|nr:hypothetical protein [Bacteroidales bacterium]